MRPLTVILDSDPETTVMWSQWEIRKATIKGKTLSVFWRHGDLIIEAVDPQLVCDMIFAHDQKNALVKGKLGIKSVKYKEKVDKDIASRELRKALRQFMHDEDE